MRILISLGILLLSGILAQNYLSKKERELEELESLDNGI